MLLWLGIALFPFGALGALQPPGETIQTTAATLDIFQNVKISRKEVSPDICGGTTSYAGYVDFEPNSMSGVEHDYPVHTFFWYFKSQNNPEDSPLIIWLNGGPGASSILGMFTENGPCHINGTIDPETNPLSWNVDYNVLYVDQPVQTGFSYDVVTPGVLDLKTGNIILDGSLEPGRTAIQGKFSSQDTKSTANTTENAARHFWNFLQVWLEDFPEHTSSDDSISIWTESYGGKYGPTFARFIHEQNALIRNGSLQGANVLNFKTLGIINGCVDLYAQEMSGPEFAYDKNPYGIDGITSDEYESARTAYFQEDGCEDLIGRCRQVAGEQDPGMYGNATDVNSACELASDFCQNEVEGLYVFRKKWGFYDISHCYLDAFPGYEFLDYLADEQVLTELGVPVNFTVLSNAVGKAFNLTGDYPRRDPKGYFEDIAILLESGIQVAMVYGDRDYACNWIGGERASLSVEYSQSDEFSAAGYANVTVDDPDQPDPVGQVRQHGLFSFTRVYESGHMVPAYKPKEAYNIVRRSMQGLDIATGTIAVTGDYSTDGLIESDQTFPPPDAYPMKCYLRFMSSTCADNQISAVEDGSAHILNGVIVDPDPTPGTCPSLPEGVQSIMKQEDYIIGEL
ncbi:carboxypeptidase S1 [Annulohypoxylon maeteangense]|uniref:carboxypeptidase S1 n=1 Tax=Annulohypoxylon maeteangense TaxID=1927788 RepID=UPI00200848B3|nr:carboxypeptidase S1 [Annulohypoxylon maeteangense]KAI0881812.1 carboxypeptidase S1 [Annulohypoxylon maeteangense]